MYNLFLGRDAFIDFSVSVTGLVLIVPALLWLYYSERNRISKSNTLSAQSTTSIFFWIILVSLVILVAPGTSLLIQKLINPYPYKSIMIMVPTVLITVYSFIHMLGYLSIHGKRKINAIICLSVLTFVSSSIYITYGHPLGFEVVSNSMKISPETKEICDVIHSDYALLPKEVYGQVGEYDSGVYADMLYDIPQDNYYTIELVDAVYRNHVPYVVINKSYDDSFVFGEYFYTKTAETDHYVIYYRHY